MILLNNVPLRWLCHRFGAHYGIAAHPDVIHRAHQERSRCHHFRCIQHSSGRPRNCESDLPIEKVETRSGTSIKPYSNGHCFACTGILGAEFRYNVLCPELRHFARYCFAFDCVVKDSESTYGVAGITAGGRLCYGASASAAVVVAPPATLLGSAALGSLAVQRGPDCCPVAVAATPRPDLWHWVPLSEL